AHLVAFRDWLADQIQRDTTRRFVNATGGGILRGSNIEQAALEDVVNQFPQPRIDLRQVARSRYTPAQAVALCEDAEALRMAAARADRAALQLFESWERFAPGLTRERI